MIVPYVCKYSLPWTKNCTLPKHLVLCPLLLCLVVLETECATTSKDSCGPEFLPLDAPSGSHIWWRVAGDIPAIFIWLQCVRVRRLCAHSCRAHRHPWSTMACRHTWALFKPHCWQVFAYSVSTIALAIQYSEEMDSAGWKAKQWLQGRRLFLVCSVCIHLPEHCFMCNTGYQYSTVPGLHGFCVWRGLLRFV